MEIYHYSEVTGEYTHPSPARLDPMETKAQGKDVFLVPANATGTKPPVAKKNNAYVFSKGKWNTVTDFRGEKYYMPGDAQERTINVLGDKPPEMSLTEMDAAAEESQKASETAKNENLYYASCYQYQLDNIDVNLLSEMSKSEALVEAGGATEMDLPLAKQNADWLDSLWTFYYGEKSAKTYGGDFAGAVGTVPNSHAVVRGERKAFIAAL